MNALTSLLTVRAADLASDGPRIDAFVRAQPGAEPFHRPQWSAAVEQGCRQRAHYLIAEEAGGALVGVLPLTEIRSLLFGNALVSAGFATGGGILAATEAAGAGLAEEAWRLARARGCASVELRGGVLPAGWECSEGVYSSFSTCAVDDEAALLGSVPRKQRAEVRKALGFGLEVSIGRDARHVETFRRIYAESVRNLGTPVFPAGLFRAMAERFGEDCDVLLVLKDGEALGGFFNFYMGDTAYGYWGAGTAAARRWRANDLVYFEFIRHAARRGCKVADFGRSKLGTGAHDRKRIWGFGERPLVYAVRTAEGAAPREINPLDPKYQARIALWRRLPLPVANLVGPMIARGLG
jgi:FemAB-related protein (PEP-CTERM system-associated)